MKKVLILLLVVCTVPRVWCLERQANADYRARREALSKKTSGAAVLMFAPMEAEGPNAVYGFRQDDNFFYLSGWVEPGAVLLIVPAAEASGEKPARSYSEILFLAPNNKVEEKWTGPKLNPTDPESSKVYLFSAAVSSTLLSALITSKFSTSCATNWSGFYPSVPPSTPICPLTDTIRLPPPASTGSSARTLSFHSRGTRM